MFRFSYWIWFHEFIIAYYEMVDEQFIIQFAGCAYIVMQLSYINMIHEYDLYRSRIITEKSVQLVICIVQFDLGTIQSRKMWWPKIVCIR